MPTISSSNTLPKISFETTEGEQTFSSHAGHYVVLYFYPKDNTSGCTKESCDFRDAMADFGKCNAVILGVSRDSIKSHENFINKQSLPFTLISDPDETMCEYFEVMKMKSMYGKQYRGIERSTFLFDPKGKLIESWRKVKVPGHVNAVLEALQAHQG